MIGGRRAGDRVLLRGDKFLQRKKKQEEPFQDSALNCVCGDTQIVIEAMAH